MSGHLYIKISAISLALIFREFVFNLMFLEFHIISSLQLSKKQSLMQFIVSVVLERTGRFQTTVDVVLEEYNNCLPSTK